MRPDPPPAARDVRTAAGGIGRTEERPLTTEPPHEVEDLARRGLRLLAATAVALLVAAVTVATGSSPVLALVVGGFLVGAGSWGQSRSDEPSALGTSAVVAGAALLVVGLRLVLTPTGDTLDLFLVGAGSAFAVGGLALDERRLVTLGLLQWALVLVRPDPDAAAFRHCLVATDLAVPVPRLDGLLLLGLGGAMAGTAQRLVGWRLEAGRGAEITGLVLLHGGLLAKSAELPDLAVLCGAGRGIDVGWVLLGFALGIATALWGVAGRDPVWAGVGAGALAAHGLVATILSGEAVWAAGALAPLAATLWAAERAGIRWPRVPGYGRQRPGRRP